MECPHAPKEAEEAECPDHSSEEKGEEVECPNAAAAEEEEASSSEG